MSAMLREPGLLIELAEAKDLIRRMALHIENDGDAPALLWGLQGIQLVVEADTLLNRG